MVLSAKFNIESFEIPAVAKGALALNRFQIFVSRAAVKEMKTVQGAMFVCGTLALRQRWVGSKETVRVRETATADQVTVTPRYFPLIGLVSFPPQARRWQKVQQDYGLLACRI